MKIDQTTARVVVIGGGVVGCSILYHLAKAGWQDVVLLERQELTSGSSWHAAGSLYCLTTPFNASVLQKYSFDLYPQLETESGQDCGFHRTGELWLAQSEEQYKAHKLIRSQGLRNGIHAEFISMEEAAALSPILNTKGLKSVMYEADAGYCDPASVTHAFAKAARRLGAKVYRHAEVLKTNRLANGEWQVVTGQGTIQAEFLVNAAGLWGREVAALAGIQLPLVPVEHHYLVTEQIPQIAQMREELPSLSIDEANVYARQEANGLLVGAYESNCRLWSEYETPKDFGHELLPDDVSRMEENFAVAVERLPCLAEAGIKSIINGPMIFSPDLGPLIGPYPGLTNYFCANGVMTGFNQGGGIGKVLAEWIINGDPGMDMSFWHVGRFGDYADHEYTTARAKFYYEHRSTFMYPYEEFDIGRPVRKRPIYEMQKKSGAVFGEYAGWEDPLYFASENNQQQPQYCFEQVSWFDELAREVACVHEKVGLFDYSSFAKYKIEGSESADWLSSILAGKVPEKIGKTTLSPMLNHRGQIMADFTVSCLAEDQYFLVGAGAMQAIHYGLFIKHNPPASVTIKNLTDEWCAFHIAGPHAGELLARVSEQNTSLETFPFLTNVIWPISSSNNVIIIRVSFTGESGFEMYFPQHCQLSVYQDLLQAGKALGLKQVGSHALMSMRLEKGFPSWGLELSSDYYPQDCGMQRFVDMSKSDFIGKKALLENSQADPIESLVTIEINARERQAFGGEAIYFEGNLAGYITSGGYGYRIKKNLALGYVATDLLNKSGHFEVELIGGCYPVKLLQRSPFDPKNVLMRR